MWVGGWGRGRGGGLELGMYCLTRLDPHLRTDEGRRIKGAPPIAADPGGFPDFRIVFEGLTLFTG